MGKKSTGWGGGYQSYRCMDAEEALAPLLAVIKRYDALRLKLEKEGGTMADVARITEQLTTKVTIQGYYRPVEVSLTDAVALHRALWDVGDGDVQLDVRFLETNKMPVYYLCRIRRDWWAEYSLIVEDLYRSPGFTLRDERFVKLMRAGHESYSLRLSQFREGMAALAGPDQQLSREDIDDMLYQLGRYVFQAAWHEDQAVGSLAATHFRLPRFGQAIELLYLALSGQLCELRAAVNDDLLKFFDVVYPHPAIKAFLGLITRLDGSSLNALPEKALKLYTRLTQAFSKFIGVEVPWGTARIRVPIYKLLFANLTRLPYVAEALQADHDAQAAAQRLEQDAQLIIDGLVA